MKKKDKENSFAKTGLGLTIILLIFTIIEELAFSINFSGIELYSEDKSSFILMVFIEYINIFIYLKLFFEAS